MKRKKIIIFSSHTTLESGGVGTHLKHLINEIKKSSYNYEIILGAKKGVLLYIKALSVLLRLFLKKENHQIIQFNLYVFALKVRLKNILDKYINDDFDKIIIHCHDKYTAFATYLLKDKYIFEIEILQTLHAPFSDQYKITHNDYPEFVNYSIIIDKGMTLSCNKLIGVDVLQTKIANDLIDFSNVVVSNISNAVDVKQLESTNTSKVDYSNYFIVARHLHKKNGIIYAIKAFDHFLNKGSQYSNYKLLIMGDGPEKSNLEKYIQENDLGKNIFLIGRKNHEESLSYIKNSVGSIIPSIPIGIYIEATSLTMLESMYLEVPVIASNVGGLAEVITNMENGLLFEPKDFEKLSHLIEFSIINNERIDVIRKNAKEKILNEFSSEIWFKNISKVYDL